MSLLEKLSITTTDHGWSAIDCALMKLYAQCLRETGDLTGQITVLLKLLLHRQTLGPNEGARYLNELEQALTQSDASMNGCGYSNVAFERTLRDYFTLQIGSRAIYHTDRDGFKIKLLLTNHFPNSIPLTKIDLKISATSGQELYFTISDLSLKPGRNEIYLTCNTTVPGVYIFEQVILQWRTLSFKQEFVEAGRKQQLILHPHGTALSVDVKMDRESMSLSRRC